MPLNLFTRITRNSVTATVGNAVSADNDGKEIVSNNLVDPIYINSGLIGEEQQAVTTTVLQLQEQQQTQYNSIGQLFNNYENNNTILTGTPITITFDTPVRDFYITPTSISDSAHPLGNIVVYDESDFVLKTFTPTRYPGPDGAVQSHGQLAYYRFSIVYDRKIIKKVVLTGAQRYSAIDFGTPLPPPPPPPPAPTIQPGTVYGTQQNTQYNPQGLASGNSQQYNQGSNYGYYYNSVRPNPHIHYITPNPHAHNITPNPHRHEMRFFESGSVDGRPRIFDDGCRLDCNVLIKLIYDSLNTELAGSKNRVTAAAKKGNWITANKFGLPICNYLENYYLYRVICYLRSRTWFTEYETLAIVPTQLDVQPTGLILANDGNNIVGAQNYAGNIQPQAVETTQQISHADIPIMSQHADTPIVQHTDVPIVQHSDTPVVEYVQCRPPGGPCSYYQATDCEQLGAIPGSFQPC